MAVHWRSRHSRVSPVDSLTVTTFLSAAKNAAPMADKKCLPHRRRCCLSSLCGEECKLKRRLHAFSRRHLHRPKQAGFHQRRILVPVTPGGERVPPGRARFALLQPFRPLDQVAAGIARFESSGSCSSPIRRFTQLFVTETSSVLSPARTASVTSIRNGVFQRMPRSLPLSFTWASTSTLPKSR